MSFVSRVAQSAPPSLFSSPSAPRGGGGTAPPVPGTPSAVRKAGGGPRRRDGPKRVFHDVPSPPAGARRVQETPTSRLPPRPSPGPALLPLRPRAKLASCVHARAGARASARRLRDTKQLAERVGVRWGTLCHFLAAGAPAFKKGVHLPLSSLRPAGREGERGADTAVVPPPPCRGRGTGGAGAGPRGGPSSEGWE